MPASSRRPLSAYLAPLDRSSSHVADIERAAASNHIHPRVDGAKRLVLPVRADFPPARGFVEAAVAPTFQDHELIPRGLLLDPALGLGRLPPVALNPAESPATELARLRDFARLVSAGQFGGAGLDPKLIRLLVPVSRFDFAGPSVTFALLRDGGLYVKGGPGALGPLLADVADAGVRLRDPGAVVLAGARFALRAATATVCSSTGAGIPSRDPTRAPSPATRVRTSSPSPRPSRSTSGPATRCVPSSRRPCGTCTDGNRRSDAAVAGKCRAREGLVPRQG